MALRKELKDSIIESNNERDAIGAKLARYGMRIVERSIFKGEIPNAIYVRRLVDYKEIISKSK